MSIASFRARKEEMDKKLAQKLAPEEKKTYIDPRFWTLKSDDKGNKSAVIRFLPPPEGEDEYFVTMTRYWFQDLNTKRWYRENSLITIGQKDPVSQYNSLLWKTGDLVKQNDVRTRKTQVKNYTNILVVSDPACPENEGKVFIYEYGKAIQTMIETAIAGVKQGDKLLEEGFNPFDPFEGADFSLTYTPGVKDTYGNYDSSRFLKQKALFNGDEKKIDEVLSQAHSLSALVAPDQFKSYEELEKKLFFVLGKTDGENRTIASNIPTVTSSTQTLEASIEDIISESPASTSTDDFLDDLDFI